MKHRALKLLLFLFLGMIINVAVAWACAYYDTRRFLDSPLSCNYASARMVFANCPLSTFANKQVIWWDGWLPLPIDPVWHRFAFNTLCYVSILWLMFVFPFALRRRRRIKRRLCPSCAYPIGTSSVCTECGTKISHKSVEPPIKRRVSKLLLFLLLGAIMNVTVGWTCVISRGMLTHTTAYYHNPSGKHPLVIAMTEFRGYSIVSGVERSGTLLDREPGNVAEYGRDAWWNDESILVSTNNFAIACGWPCFALTSWRTVLNDDEMAFPGVVHKGILWHSIVSSGAPGDAETFTPILALQPLWPGFAINTLFYAALLWMTFAFPFALRRRSRIKRRLCPSCAYPIGPSPNCSECGKKVRA